MRNIALPIRVRTAACTLAVACVLAGLGAARPGEARARLVERYGRLPLTFETNLGQHAEPARFLVRGGGLTAALQPDGALFWPEAAGASGESSAAPARLRLVGARSRARMAGEALLPGRVNYLRGRDPARWRTNVPLYRQVRCEDVYPGIDLLYHSAPTGELEYDFQVAAGANPGRIRLEMAAPAGAPRLDAHGDLLVPIAGGALRHHRPVAYQASENGRRVPVTAAFRLQPADGRSVGRAVRVRLALGEYDRSRPLVIDPTVTYATYFGGADTDTALAVAVNPAGEAFVAGTTRSTNLPTVAGSVQPLNRGQVDAFVAKVSADGSTLIYCTYLGGARDDHSAFARMGLAVDRDGSAYVTGFTDSTDFPTTPGAFNRTARGFGDTYVAKLDATGSRLEYSTLLGGASWDYGNAIAVDGAGGACVVGATGSADFPVTSSARQSVFGGGVTDVFVARLNATGSALTYATLLGGSGNDSGWGVALDGSGRVYLTGATGSTNFPVTPGALRGTNAGGTDAFIAVVTPGASGAASLPYSSYFGGTGNENPFPTSGIAVDGSGFVYLTGTTTSGDLPVENPVQATRKGTWDAFVAKLDLATSSLVYSTYLGGMVGTEGNSIAVDAAGSAFVSGLAMGRDFPQVEPLQAHGNSPDAFVAQLAPGGGALLFSSYFGGESAENFSQAGYGALALDGAGSVYLAGTTSSAAFPVVSALFSAGRGGQDAYLAKIRLAAPVVIPNPPSGLTAELVTASEVRLQWADNSLDETGFRIERRTESGSWGVLSTVSANIRATPDKSVAANTRYTYRVRSFNSAGDSAPSNEAEITTAPSVPAAPANLTATAASQNRIELAWNDRSDNETSFEVERRTEKTSFRLAATVGPDVTQVADIQIAANTTYIYRVKASNARGSSPYSNEARATTPANPPVAPTELRVVAVTASQVDLAWRDRSDNESGFEIERRVGTGSFASHATVGANVTTYTDTGLAVDTTYAYRVRSRSAAGESPWTAEVTATTTDSASGRLVVPADVSFPTLRHGRRTSSRRLVIRNGSENQPLRVTVQAPAAPFFLTGGTVSLTIPARGKETLTFVFRSQRRGTSEGVLRILSSDALRPTAVVNLVGTRR